MNKKFKNDLKQSFYAGKPARKEKFLMELDFPKMRYTEVFLNQIHYISKIFWLVSLAVLGLSIYISTISEPQVIKIMSSFVPLSALVLVIELHKSSSYNMEELELTFKHNLAQTTIIKLIIVGGVSFFTMCFAMIFIQIEVFSILLPYLAVSSISLLITNFIKGIAGVYACIGATSFILVINYLIVLNEVVIRSGINLLTAMVLVMFIISQVAILIKRNGGKVWSFV